MRHTQLVTAALAAVALVPGNAVATDAVVITASGTFFPGLPATGCAYQEIGFLGTMVSAGVHSGTYGIGFHGESDICETLLTGQGRGIVYGEITGSIAYARTGTFVTLSGSLTFPDGTTETIQAGGCDVSSGWHCDLVLQ